MCGISGIFNRAENQMSVNLINCINDTLVHRGPDFGKVELYENVALAHRRLSIIDLSTDANQPMSTSDGRYIIVFNGEIYNFQEIRLALEKRAVSFSSHSDTEVILHAFEAYGCDCFSMFNGMFALAIYDHTNGTVLLARDQFGIKPLYFSNSADVFIFGSEIKAILKHPSFNFTLNKQALVEYFWFENALGENTFYNEIKEVKPGTILIVSEKEIQEKAFFNIYNIKETHLEENALVEKLRCLLEESVKRHLISDVPVGVFLSGGVDSSAITAFAAKHYKGKLKTYSVSFDYDKGQNELALARQVAHTFNTDHHEIHISGEDIIEVIEKLVIAHDEPFGDAADIPLYLLTKKLKGEVKVVLQGDGGDEFFGGYSRYNTVSNSKKWAPFSFLSKVISLSGTQNVKALRLQRFLNAISEKSEYKRNALLLTMESRFSNPLRVFNSQFEKTINQLDPFSKFKQVYSQYPSSMDPVQKLFYTDVLTVLKDTYFEKVDKATMANSMEIRVPFVDKELAEFALSIPASLKTAGGKQKYLLKKALEGIVPDNILYGKKKGFGVPYGDWLKTSLSAYFIKQVSTDIVSLYLDKEEILKMFELHKKDKGNFGFLLWKTLIFSVWLNSYSGYSNVSLN